MIAVYLVALMIVSAAGAWASVLIKAGRAPWWWIYPLAILSTTCWLCLARSKTKITTAAVLFDVVCSATYLGMMLLMGETLTVRALCGAALAITGLAMMS